MKSTIRQVYFQPSQALLCDYTPYHNNNCDEFFENSVISKMVLDGDADQGNCDYFGVLSWNVRKKIERGPGPRIGVPRSGVHLKERVSQLLKNNPDIIGMVEYAPHDNVKHWRDIHPRLEEMFLKVVSEISPIGECQVLDHHFYSNHFIARSEIYREYVLKFLNPAMSVMKTMPELWENSGYPKSLPSELRMKFGMAHYPFHTFICERLFAYFVHLKRISNIVYY